LYFDAIRDGLEKCGRIMHGGTIVNATIIAAPSSTKNAFRERDPEMHQTQKGNQWHFGMKMHAGVDAGTGYIHTITATTANVHDVDQAAELIREDDTVVYGDAAYLGIEKRDEVRNDPNKSAIDYRINLRPGKVNALADGPAKDWFHIMEHQKSAVRCKVEHVFQLLKSRFDYSKVRYRGIEKNLSCLYMICGSINLWFVATSGGWHRPTDAVCG
jgi:IS5 family transposase